VGDAVLIRADRAADAIWLALRLDAELSGAPSLPPIHAGAHTSARLAPKPVAAPSLVPVPALSSA